ncbi:ABC transporter permease [Lysinibacillus xylanilyticus]|uniref:oligopeptide ABC transporter permease n=1 Tax=Lysinibacillus xylanilyticus TaxID=582475 RepID=UPI002B24E3D3|nr:oligopeptide ABC transporter permease [Lysinibacillus xylanilyticus]MEB2278611.1 ABC transporter permease [Lysinibacillus xylanilyticus]
MWKTVLRRVIIMVPQIIILSMLVFIIAKLMPGDPFTGLMGPETDPNRIEELREAAGLNDPWYQQYARWVSNAVHGDLGKSYTYQRSVTSLIGERALNTFYLSLVAMILTYLIAIPLGLLAGRYQDSRLDRGIVFYNFLSMAIPPFVFGLILIYVFGYKLGWVPTSGSVDVLTEKGTLSYYWDKLYHIITPAITMAVLGTYTVIQYLRSEIIDSKNQDYVKTARSKGLPMNKVYTRHIFRNSLIPIAAGLGFTITGLLGGTIFIETIFSYPGMGELFMSSIASRDYSVITALIVLYGFLGLLGSMLSDIILSIVDPRIRID